MKRSTPPSLRTCLVVGVAVAGVGCSGEGPADPPGGAVTLPLQTPADFQACRGGTTASGALTELCLPASWNGQLIVWAHGYVNPGPERPPNEPLAVPADAVGGVSVRQVILGTGDPDEGFYGYAASSYRRNGLVSADAVEDVEQLLDWADDQLAELASPGLPPLPVRTLMVGASEGALTTALAVEDGGVTALDGGLALCGPIGDFRAQIDWLGDFRVLFDFYFPGVMPGTATQIPASEISDATWTSLQAQIRSAIQADPGAGAQLTTVTGVLLDPADPNALGTVAVDVLRFSFFGTNDTRAVLGGNPYDNTDRVYSGSADDAALNAGVDRFAADPAALDALLPYQTTGHLRVSLVTLHTLGDPVVPAAQQNIHASLVNAAGQSTRLTDLPASPGFSHCGFDGTAVLAAFNALISAVG